MCVKEGFWKVMNEFHLQSLPGGCFSDGEWDKALTITRREKV